MLNLLSRSVNNCEKISRRNMLQIGALGSLGLTLPTALKWKQAAAAGNKSSSDMNCILIWTLGGTSHIDTFDPKPDAPASIRGEFGVIDTAVPGIQFTEIMPNLAQELKRFAVLRSWNPRNGSHGSADAWVLSGRKFNATVTYPTYGSVVSHQMGFKSAMPPFVQLGNSVNRTRDGGTAGILGMQYNPFEIHADANKDKFTVRDITPPSGVDMSRVDRRRQMLSAIDNLQMGADLQPEAFSALDEHYKTAFNMITAPETKRAFEIDQEETKLRDAYGRTPFGQRCLLARRLIESGVRFVTVSDPGWDTHGNNFKSLKNSRIPPVDKALPQLLKDLEERGMLDNTLVVWLTDFGRTPKVNSASGRDHWATAGSILMAGAGTPGGAVLGATDDEAGAPIKNQYFTGDIAATIYQKLGLPLDLLVYAPDGRPIPLVEGNVIREFV